MPARDRRLWRVPALGLRPSDDARNALRTPSRSRSEGQGWMRRRSTFTSTRPLLTALPTGGSPPAPKSALN
eukprot:3691282-Prymnesium_polylepis.1